MHSMSDLTKEAGDLFNLSVFPAYRASLKSEKTRRASKTLIEDMELLCGKPFLLLNDADGVMYAQLLAARYKPTTTNVRLSFILSIAAFCERNAEIYMKDTSFSMYRSPFSNLKRFAKTSDYVDAYSIPTPEQLNDFLGACDEEVALIVTLIVKCGLFGRHIRKLCLKDIWQDNGRYYIRLIENGRAMNLFVPDDAAAAILSYCSRNEPSLDGTIFKNIKNRMMSERVIERHYKRQADLCNFKYSMLDLRNAAAAFMLAGGATKEDVANYMGITQKWSDKFNLAQDRIASFDASEYSTITIKPYKY